MSDPQPSNVFQFLEQIYELNHPAALTAFLDRPQDCSIDFDPRSLKPHLDRAYQNAIHTHQLQTQLAQLQQISHCLTPQPTIHLTKTTFIPIGLTPRQSEILFHVAQGNTNAAIAQALGVHPTTIKTHLANIRQKLNATSRLSAVTIALKQLGITP
jgi:DNA-binding NarL/FixJ family response regulator